ncbi:alpha-hydroxy acid oxidase [Promicromonospora sukumoe]
MTAAPEWAGTDQIAVREAVEAYVHGGPGDGATVRANVAAWEALPLRPRVLRDVTHVDTAIELLGLRAPVPVLAAPWAGHQLVHPDGEVATARGLAAAGLPMVQSAGSSVPVADVAAHSGPFWQQVYVPDDRTLIDGFLDRAAAAGATALVLTVDHPAVGNTLPFRAGLARLAPSDGRPRVAANFPDVAPGTPLGTATDLGPRDVERLAARTGLPVLVKGVLRADDARTAVDAGAAAVVVSNHGGRQLAGSVTTAHALLEVVDAVGGRVPVLVDGGIRRGEDVVRALALGARAVLAGRPVARALAEGGADGVERWARDTIEDVRRALVLCGAPTLASVGRDLVGGPVAGPVTAYPGER